MDMIMNTIYDTNNVETINNYIFWAIYLKQKQYFLYYQKNEEIKRL